jgi:hypothetical protein
MLRNGIRTFGLFFGGLSLFLGGGVATIYGLLLFYVASPGSAAEGGVIAPLNRLTLGILTHPLFVPVAAVGLSVFLVDVHRNGLLDLDDRTYWERKKDMRRRKAAESEAWDPPAEDLEEPTMYDELVDQVQSGELVMADHEASVDGRPSVRGVVRNTSPRPFRDVRVKVGFVDREGGVVDTRMPTTKRIDPSSSWEFEVFYTAGDGAVANYRISEPEGTEVQSVEWSRRELGRCGVS